ncbi:hypothetical protein HQO84_05450 [Rhodococcus fascians]|nr:hypothetical protein [Rhodococcus fascians]MBY3999568.1 hypothetical protein [Rhodococcus fascians]MBY4001220.1 hypothetical protein [Rhodococcus fascians]MBY4009531.1 hypothetical protein [Rhodococcus fascians]MBY4015358.1 hypothetical protein [Rhodococcus fascians]
MSILDHLDRMNIAGETLRYVRTSHGLSAQQVADTASMSCGELRDIETQAARCTSTTAKQIVHAISALQHPRKVDLNCTSCGEYVVTVNAPAPPVPITCASCRNAY